MAKELPYFKFEPSEWENGKIQMCDRESKGLFMDLCSIYWSRLGDLPFKLAVQKLCGGNATAFDSLLENEVFRVEDGFVYIEFLEIQLKDFETISNQNKENAVKGWEKRRQAKKMKQHETVENQSDSQIENATAMRPHNDGNATAFDSQCETDAIKVDKIKVDKRKEENTKFDFRKNLISENFDLNLVDDWLKVRKTKRAANTETAFKMFMKEILQAETNYGKTRNEILELTVSRSWQTFKCEYIQNSITQNYGGTKPNTSDKQSERNAVVERALGKIGVTNSNDGNNGANQPGFGFEDVEFVQID